MKPYEVNAAKIRRSIENKLAEGLNPTDRPLRAPVEHALRGHHRSWPRTVESGGQPATSTRRLYKSTFDVQSTPFLERPADIRRLYRRCRSRTT